MDKSEKIYHLTAEASKLIYDLGLNGWATEWELEGKNGEKVSVEVKFNVKKSKQKTGREE